VEGERVGARNLPPSAAIKQDGLSFELSKGQKVDTSAHVMQCMEIIGGNRAERRTITAPGLDIWVDSRPLAPGKGGGDVHYVSTCGAGYVTRLALADIAGHGESVDGLAIALRKLMRKYINTLDQTRFARALNRELNADVDFGRFATAVLLTYFAPTRHLIICNAGHGRPLRYSATHNKWGYLDLKSAGGCSSLRASRARYHLERLSNLPLGVLAPVEYEQLAVELDEGDLVLIYTDAITESMDDTGGMLGEVGLLTLVNKFASANATELGEQLVAAIDRRRGKNSDIDDQTVIVIKRAEAPLPRASLLRTARTLAKLVRLRRV
jgi:sigma-B regulation protein RsbU (phosphoserine phosphatase)